MLDRPYLLKRLKEARLAREEFEDRNPTVTFCLSCDEVFVDETAECELEHRHITEGWDQAEISAWIDCIEYCKKAES